MENSVEEVNVKGKYEDFEEHEYEICELKGLDYGTYGGVNYTYEKTKEENGVYNPSDYEICDMVHKAISKRWYLYWNIHHWSSMEDVVNELLCTLYEYGRDGVKRVDKYVAKGERHFKNIINLLAVQHLDFEYRVMTHHVDSTSLDLEPELYNGDRLSLHELVADTDVDLDKELSMSLLYDRLDNIMLDDEVTSPDVDKVSIGWILDNVDITDLRDVRRVIKRINGKRLSNDMSEDIINEVKDCVGFMWGALNDCKYNG